MFLFLIDMCQSTVKRMTRGEQCLGELWETPGKRAEGLSPHVHLVPRIALGHGFAPPVSNIYIQFIRRVYSPWMSEHSYRTQSGEGVRRMLSSVCPESGHGLCLLSCFLIKTYSTCQTIVFKLIHPEKVRGKGCSVNI